MFSWTTKKHKENIPEINEQRFTNATSAPNHNRIDADSISLSAVYFWPMFDVNP